MESGSIQLVLLLLIAGAGAGLLVYLFLNRGTIFREEPQKKVHGPDPAPQVASPSGPIAANYAAPPSEALPSPPPLPPDDTVEAVRSGQRLIILGMDHRPANNGRKYARTPRDLRSGAKVLRKEPPQSSKRRSDSTKADGIEPPVKAEREPEPRVGQQPPSKDGSPNVPWSVALPLICLIPVVSFLILFEIGDWTWAENALDSFFGGIVGRILSGLMTISGISVWLAKRIDRLD